MKEGYSKSNEPLNGHHTNLKRGAQHPVADYSSLKRAHSGKTSIDVEGKDRRTAWNMKVRTSTQISSCPLGSRFSYSALPARAPIQPQDRFTGGPDV
ncbi:hypothetical protein M404DRAFT_1008990, partial [Pisolithus tinctorius Marx 270]